MAKHYNTRVKHRDFQVGDLILRKVTSATRDPFEGKQRKGTYHLETLDERKLHHLWNTKHLKKYYQ